MARLTFSGGIHPYDGKDMSKSKPIKDVDPKGELVYPLSQHIGAPAKPVVAKGDHVLAGQLIAEAGGFVSAPIYASVSGIVKNIEPRRVVTGDNVMSIVIENDGTYEEVEWPAAIDFDSEEYASMTREEKLERIRKAGIVGMGGATFPCHVKLTPPKGTKAECVIINAVECEPYLTADHRLLLEKPDEILVGVDLIMKAVGVNKGYIGIENNKPDAIALLTEKAKAYSHIEIVPLQVKYPQGGEKQLIAAVTGCEVPAPPALPINVGAVVQNVGTVFAIYEAVMKNKPLFERVITVTGKEVQNPSNLLARIGTPMNQLIEECGGLPENTGKVIGGGPMMGKALMNLDVPVCKGSSGLLLMSEKESRRAEPQPCIRCAKCVSACPMGLEPYLLATASALRNWELAEENDITSCIECGSCQFTCPSTRPMLDNIRMGKTTVMALIRARNAK